MSVGKPVAMAVHVSSGALVHGLMGGMILAVSSTLLLGAIGQLSGVSGIIEAAAFGSDSGWQIR